MELLDSIRRRRLTQKGLSSGKKRRTQTDGPVAIRLDRSTVIRYSVYVVFALFVSVMAFNFANGRVDGARPVSAAAGSLLAVVMAILLFEVWHPKTARRNGHVFLIFSCLAVQLGFIWLVTVTVETNPVLPESLKLLLVPYALAPMILAVLLRSNLGLYAVAGATLLGAFLIDKESLLPYLVMSAACGLSAVIVTQEVRKRGRLLRGGFYAGGAAVLLACSFNIISLGPLNGGGVLEWQLFGIEVASAFGIGLVTGMIVSGLLPILESTFTLTTDISWLELSDLNHKLLRRMQLEAPGTFHHSMVVASLAEAAAEEIGANPMMCRVCSYFHDIGKLQKPAYFIENQGENNPHDSLTPTMSALVIIAHVKDGVDMAIKSKLNPRIIDVIREHHGNSLVYYFYRKAQEQRRVEEGMVEEGLENPEDVPEVDAKNFRYPGPTPQTLESGIISLADAVESASRTLRKPTPRKIRSLVDDIVFNRIKDGQLDNCGLTVSDLKKTRDSFANTLRSMMHSRIDYPKREKQTGDSQSDSGSTGGLVKNVVPVEELEKQRRKAAGDP
ncbi:MAG: HDIG domain-containing protein [Roseibacillus sp.]|nr:HDIG domain-containing protein [Roseibacillus sp.]